jgi:hypothetical protein
MERICTSFYVLEVLINPSIRSIEFKLIRPFSPIRMTRHVVEVNINKDSDENFAPRHSTILRLEINNDDEIFAPQQPNP